MTKSCAVCGISFTSGPLAGIGRGLFQRNSGAKTCSKACQYELSLRRGRAKPKRPKLKTICKICSKPFIANAATKTCGPACRAENLRRKHLNYNRFRMSFKSYRSKRYEKEKQRRRTDPSFRMKVNLSERMRKVLKGKIKAGRTHELLGCDRQFFVQWIERQLRPGWNWSNYGTFWVLDHKIPCSSFDLSQPSEQKKCFHYTNIQPLTWVENEAKKAKVVPTQPEFPIAITVPPKTTSHAISASCRLAAIADPRNVLPYSQSSVEIL